MFNQVHEHFVLIFVDPRAPEIVMQEVCLNNLVASND